MPRRPRPAEAARAGATGCHRQTGTRTGDTVYGFNSTAGHDAYDFTVNTNPVIAIWDAGAVTTPARPGQNFSGRTTPISTVYRVIA